MSKPRSWLASIDSPVVSKQIMRLDEITPRRTLLSSHQLVLSTLPNACSGLFEANPRRKTARNLLDSERQNTEEDLEDLWVGQLSARSVKSERLPVKSFLSSGALLHSLSLQIAVKTGGLAPSSLKRPTPSHRLPVNPAVSHFLNRFQHKLSAKPARIGRKGFQPQRVFHRSVRPAKPRPATEDYIEYLSLQPSKS